PPTARTSSGTACPRIRTSILSTRTSRCRATHPSSPRPANTAKPSLPASAAAASPPRSFTLKKARPSGCAFCATSSNRPRRSRCRKDERDRKDSKDKSLQTTTVLLTAHSPLPTDYSSTDYCKMLLLPAIDLMSGQVVRLRQGKADQKT